MITNISRSSSGLFYFFTSILLFSAFAFSPFLTTKEEDKKNLQLATLYLKPQKEFDLAYTSSSIIVL